MKPVYLVIHGVGHRLEDEFRAQVEGLASQLGIDATFVPVFWGDILRPDSRIDTILPYRHWADPEHPVGLRPTSNNWHRILGGVYNMVHDAYVRASSQFTGDLLYYQRHHRELWARVWEILERDAPGAGGPDMPVSVIAHSLGSAIIFDMAVAAEPRLHIDHLVTCATQSPFFHVIGCSPLALDPHGTGEPVVLPPTIGDWTNFYVPLDPWAYLAAPVFTLADGTAPADIEVRSGNRNDRIAIHRAQHYWNHPIVIDTIRTQNDQRRHP